MRIWSSVVVILMSLSAIGQSSDDILFTVEEIEVPVSEFKHIYEKTNGDEADYSEESVEEYLDLYVNFKLKVKKAIDMGLHENAKIKRELKGYRDQLATSYLTDKQIKDKLIREVYERQQTDREVSHILFGMGRNKTPEDTLKAYNRAMSVYERLQKGEDFASLAKQYSADQSSVQQGGYLGFVTAMLPNGFYEVENAVYLTPVGEVSKPVRSEAGYHIVKVHSERPARGSIEIAHIFAMKGEENPGEAEEKIKEFYTELQDGALFEKVCQEKSDDKKTAKKGGYIGKISIGQYEEVFEDAAYSLKEDGLYSEPIETSVGWHIIKRISKNDMPPLETNYRYIESLVVRDARFQIAENALVREVRKNSDIEVKEELLDAFIEEQLDSTLVTYRWAAPKDRPDTSVLIFDQGTSEFSLRDYVLFLMKSARERVSLGKSMDYEGVAKSLFDNFIDESCLRHEESQLEEKYPEFAALMKEYTEGILLFEATKVNVWDKASKDSVGIQGFFDNNKSNYVWEERARIKQYTVYSSDPLEAREVREMASKLDDEALLEKYNAKNKTMLTSSEIIIEKSNADQLQSMEWEEGAVGSLTRQGDKAHVFKKIEEILPAGQKTLDESKGYVVADYQDALEKKWVEELKEQYEVDIHKRTLKKLIQ
ncbi:MAG TPA: peptidylprolyl isomerase [Saprospiraceae bacterium]|nr:peptidylprolyl isomerase [Saprospiraceae bacterium]